MNRIDRLSAILIQLQSRKLVKAQDIAERFSISLRTVYRDVKALEEAGVPVSGEAGIGYRLMEGYKLPPVMFSRDEAAALLTAGKLMQSKTDKNTAFTYTSALDKIRAILRIAEKDHLEEIDEHIAVLHPLKQAAPAELHLQPLLKSVALKIVVDINYTSLEKDETLLRKIEPVGIYNLGNYWYLIAFCRLRNDYRNFRTDRIESLIFTQESVTKTHPPLQRFINQMAAKKEVIKVVIDVDKNILKFFGEQKYYNGFIKEEEAGNCMRLTFLTGSLQGFARWFMLFGDKANIVEPLALKDIILLNSENIVKRINKSNHC